MKRLVLLHGMSARLDDCFGSSVKEWAREFGFEIIEPFFPLEKDITIFFFRFNF